jgi:hypothetical protein
MNMQPNIVDLTLGGYNEHRKNLILEKAMKTQRGSRGIALLFL